MVFPRFGRLARSAAAAAVAALLAAPAFAAGPTGFGGFHAGARGGARAVGSRLPPPAIDAPAARPPLVAVRRQVRTRVGFVKVRARLGRRGRFQRRATLPWGWWGGGFGSYAVAGPEPVSMAEPAPAPEPAICPELLTWSPRLGRAIRQRLCDAPAGGLAEGWAPVQPRG